MSRLLDRRGKRPEPDAEGAAMSGLLPQVSTTSNVAIACEARFERSENLIAQRAARRDGAMQRSPQCPLKEGVQRLTPRALQ